MTAFDTIIRGGKIVDGTGSPAYYADVGITNGRIAAIGNLARAKAKQILDAKGKIVAPGHVTQHAHYDVALFWDPYCSNSGENGVTTVVNANCGFGVAPVHKRDMERTMQMLETTEQIPVMHQRSALPWDWESFPEWLARVKKVPKGVNVLTYLPLNPLLVYVMGVDAAKARRPTVTEMADIHRLINEAMDAGAIGISMSAMGVEGNSHVDYDGTPMPTDAIHHDTIVDICRAVVERGEGVIQLLSHIITYGDRSVSERVAELAAGSGAHVMHNSFVAIDAMPEAVEKNLAWLDALRAKGCDITVSCMAHRAWIESDIKQLDVVAGQLSAVREICARKTDEDVTKLISDPEFQRAFMEEYKLRGPAHGAGLDSQTVIGVGDHDNLKRYLDRTLADIAKEEGRHPIEVLLDLALRSKLALQLKSGQVTATDPMQGARLMAHAGVILGGGADGGAHTKSFGTGHYATDLLLWYVKERKLKTIEDMHFQLSLKTARSVQIFDRGAILNGYWADILIYDLDALYFDQSRYEILHDMPNGDWRRKGRAGGYDYILVNGVITHQRDVPTGATPGQFVRVCADRSAQAVAAE
jgi:N-acyl-D-aspartate/D-glutamate deacylase